MPETPTALPHRAPNDALAATAAVTDGGKSTVRQACGVDVTVGRDVDVTVGRDAGTDAEFTNRPHG